MTAGGHPAFTELAELCFAGTVDDAAGLVVERALSGRGGYVCLCNVHVLSTARRQPELATVLEGAWLRLADGAPVAWLQRRVGREDAERVGGPDLMTRVLEVSAAQGLRHYFVGSTAAVLETMRSRVADALPGATIAGTLSPPFGPLDAALGDEVVLELRRTMPQIVWVGLGAPKQEYWMHRVAPLLPSTVFVGVGAAFDFLAGARARAPRWMQERGLEWLYRLRLEPRRLFGRYVRTNSEFVLVTLSEIARRRIST